MDILAAYLVTCLLRYLYLRYYKNVPNETITPYSVLIWPLWMLGETIDRVLKK